MQSTDGRSRPTGAPDVQKEGAQASPGGRRMGAGIWTVLVGVIVGLAIGLFAFWTDPQPVAEDEAWGWSLPELSAEIEPAYQELFETARGAVAQVMETIPNNPDAISALGVLCYLAHDRTLEEVTWQHCLKLDPVNALAYSRLFSLAEEEANYQRIVELANEATVQDPGNAEYPGRLGSALRYLKRNEEAKAVLERLVRDGRGDADAYFVLAEACFQMDELQQANRHYAVAVALAPYNPSMLFGLAKCCRKLGQTELTAEYQRQFEELKAAQTAARKGEASSRQRFRDELHIPNRVSEILRFVGKAYLDAGQLELAEQSWLKAAEVSADDVESRQLLANLYGDHGQLQQALHWVRDLRRVAPNDGTHYRNEGVLLTRLKQYDEAERIFRDLCRQEPTNSSSHAVLAQLLVQRGGDLAEAKSLAVRAVELEPTAPRFFQLATVADKAGDLASARVAIQEAMTRDPDNREYRRFYASITQPR